MRRATNDASRVISKPMKQKAPEICPVCEAEVPRNAQACPECGADHNSGWREDADVRDALGADDAEFSYDTFVRQEFGHSPKPKGVKTIWWLTAIVLIFLTVLYFSVR